MKLLSSDKLYICPSSNLSKVNYVYQMRNAPTTQSKEALRTTPFIFGATLYIHTNEGMKARF
jgi:hypothetical protein